MVGLKRGMTIVDLGCGEGFFALPAARRVGPGGRVYAVDINPEAVTRLAEQAASEGLSQIFTEVKEAEATIICEGCADIVFFGNDLHDFSDPGQVIRNAKTMLKPFGHLADLDWKPVQMEFGPPLWKRFSLEIAKGLIESGEFWILSVQDAGPYHYLILAGK
jgi:ubiquinone/menaquinone biosynthesis C-methylase UbiE